MKKIQVTTDGFDKLQAELESLTKTKRQAARDRLQLARGMGDLSENSEYVAAKEELSFIEGRITELQELIANAEVVTVQDTTDLVDIGCRVMVELNGEKDEFILVGEFEADPIEKKLSHTSPIGKALMGRKIGEEIEVVVPIGKMKYTIVDIKKA